MANLRTYPNEANELKQGSPTSGVKNVGYDYLVESRCSAKFGSKHWNTHWRIAVANIHRANIYRTRKPARDERAFVAGGYVMAWDADRFQTYAD